MCKCKLIIPGTFIVCGEEKNYCCGKCMNDAAHPLNGIDLNLLDKFAPNLRGSYEMWLCEVAFIVSQTTPVVPSEIQTKFKDVAEDFFLSHYGYGVDEFATVVLLAMDRKENK